ncbi:MarC family protein [Thiomonas sp.]|jgi:MarC family membrane protein|uniref:MarC family protein n=1 Tax=Thiomonas sp. TaxID=2047785 RepID=UPI002609A833|nr:MarC family protein [Thiomonas sp.]
MFPHNDFWSTLILLLLILDPFGNMPVFLAVTRGLEPRRRTWVTLRESLIAYLVLLAFMAGGRGFLDLLGLRQASLEVAGGVILLLVAIKMIFSGSETMFGQSDQREPLIFPLAVPLLAGPSALAAVLLLSSATPGAVVLRVGALSAAMGITTALLLLAEEIFRRLGDAVMRAAEKLMGLIVSAIAVNMLLEGLRSYFLMR